MAQGGLKKQSSKFVLPSKTRPKGTKTISKKSVGPKKGRKNALLPFMSFVIKQYIQLDFQIDTPLFLYLARYIAPKKANIVRIEKLKKVISHAFI